MTAPTAALLLATLVLSACGAPVPYPKTPHLDAAVARERLYSQPFDTVWRAVVGTFERYDSYILDLRYDRASGLATFVHPLRQSAEGDNLSRHVLQDGEYVKNTAVAYNAVMVTPVGSETMVRFRSRVRAMTTIRTPQFTAFPFLFLTSSGSESSDFFRQLDQALARARE